MVVMCGKTYAQRLWCAWELFVLCCFCREGGEEALADRMTIVHLDGDGLAALRKFDVRAARCYDPNEEGRLRSVIELLGSDRFNARIRTLAEKASDLAPELVSLVTSHAELREQVREQGELIRDLRASLHAVVDAQNEQNALNARFQEQFTALRAPSRPAAVELLRDEDENGSATSDLQVV